MGREESIYAWTSAQNNIMGIVIDEVVDDETFSEYATEF